MAIIVQTLTGAICEPCYVFNSGTDPEYWADDSAWYAHCEAAALEWAELGYMVLDTGEEQEAHFGNSCIACGTPPYAGNVYDGTLTVFQR